MRLILGDSRADEGPSRGSRGGADPRTSTGSGGGGTDQRAGGGTTERAETCSLAGGRFAGIKTCPEKDYSRDRRDKMLFHNAFGFER